MTSRPSSFRSAAGPDTAGERPTPFAVGLLGVSDRAGDRSDRREERLQIALATHALGYFLLDVVEVQPGEAAGYDHAEALAVRTDADAFVVRGRMDDVRLAAMADRIRMRIRYSGP